MKDSSEALLPRWRIDQWFPELNPQTKDYLKAYHTELLKFNKTVNLIGVKTIEHADAIHFADCILAHKVIVPHFKQIPIYDFGSGNGFPGVVFAILSPQYSFKLVEIDQRKSEFLKFVVSSLKLKNVEVLNVKLESLPLDSVDQAICRAFAPISKSILLGRKIFKLGGKFFHMKGEEWATEIASIPTQLCTFWQPSLLGDYKLPVGEVRFAIVQTEKISS